MELLNYDGLSEYKSKYDEQLSGIVADVYDNTSTYSVGDYCIHYAHGDNKLYKCIVDIVEAEEWNATHWIEVTTTGELEDIQDVLDDIEGRSEDKVYGPASTVTFDSNAEGVPFKKIESTFTPTQDLHGYNNPWPAGGGKNLFNINREYAAYSADLNINNYYVGISTVGGYKDNDGSAGYVDGNTMYIDYVDGSYGFGIGFPIKVNSETTYTASILDASSNCLIYHLFYDSEWNYLSHVGLYLTYNAKSRTITTPENCAYIMPLAFKTSGSSGIASATGYQLELGSTATTYEPYENICPITGWTGCSLNNTNSAMYNPETNEFDFSEKQLGTGTPSATNYRQIVPGLILTRDDSTEITVYGGSLKVNSDGTSILTAKRDVLIWDSTRNPIQLNYLRTVIVWSASTYLWGGSDHKCDRAYEGNMSSSIIIGAFGRMGTSWCFSSPTQEIHDIEDTAEWLAAMKTWLDANPITICSKLYTYKTYTLSLTETARALEYLGIRFQSIPITFTNPSTRDPMTIYGGTLTLNEDGSVDVITTWASVKPGTTGFGFASQSAYQKTFNGILYGGAYAYTSSGWHIGQIYNTGFCDKIKIGATSGINGDYANITLHGAASASSVDIWVRADLLANMSDKNATRNSINAWFVEHDIMLVIRLREPLYTYHFCSVEQLKSFIGQNNVWTSLNGTTKVTLSGSYLNTINNYVKTIPTITKLSIAPTETSYTATSNYSINDIFFVNNILYRATAQIASGGTITPDTNCVKTSIDSELTSLLN